MDVLVDMAYGSFPAGRAGLALLAFRAFVGGAFILHGLGRIHDLRGFAADHHISWGMGLAAKLTQLAGGAMLVLGLLTPLAAIGISTTMVVAAGILVRKGERFINPGGHSWEGCAFYALAGIVIALLGPGRYSIDALLLDRLAS
ncbi:MAG: DoxX family protein [Acidobacteriota bacterium]